MLCGPHYLPNGFISVRCSFIIYSKGKIMVSTICMYSSYYLFLSQVKFISAVHTSYLYECQILRLVGLENMNNVCAMFFFCDVIERTSILHSEFKNGYVHFRKNCRKAITLYWQTIRLYINYENT